MSRFALVGGILLLAGALVGVSASPKAAPVPPGPPEVSEVTVLAALRTLVKDWPEVPVDPQTKFFALLESIREKLRKELKIEIQFTINTQAFAADGIEDVENVAIVKEKPLRAMRNVTLERYLREILERIPAATGASYLVRRDSIEITIGSRFQKQVWGTHAGPFLPLVHGRFEKKPLEDVLKELAEQSEHNVVLDPKAGEKAKTLITTRLLNLPLDTAVATLADMAELQSILQDNLIYVTTRENALRWETRNKKEADAESAGPRIGTGVRGFFFFPGNLPAPPGQN